MLKMLTLAVSMIAGLANGASAAEFPSEKPIKIVVGFNAGGLTDVIARITADYLQKRLGQAVVVENRPGAAAAIAAGYVPTVTRSTILRRSSRCFRRCGKFCRFPPRVSPI